MPHHGLARAQFSPATPNVGVCSGIGTLTSGNLGGATDNNSAGSPQADQPITGAYSIDSTGLGLIPASCTPGTNCQLIFYVVSPARATVIQLQHFGGTTQRNPAVMPADE